jgi:hypothetical protein
MENKLQHQDQNIYSHFHGTRVGNTVLELRSWLAKVGEAHRDRNKSNQVVVTPSSIPSKANPGSISPLSTLLTLAPSLTSTTNTSPTVTSPIESPRSPRTYQKPPRPIKRDISARHNPKSTRSSPLVQQPVSRIKSFSHFSSNNDDDATTACEPAVPLVRVHSSSISPQGKPAFRTFTTVPSATFPARPAPRTHDAHSVMPHQTESSMFDHSVDEDYSILAISPCFLETKTESTWSSYRTDEHASLFTISSPTVPPVAATAATKTTPTSSSSSSSVISCFKLNKSFSKNHHRHVAFRDTKDDELLLSLSSTIQPSHTHRKIHQHGSFVSSNNSGKLKLKTSTKANGTKHDEERLLLPMNIDHSSLTKAGMSYHTKTSNHGRRNYDYESNSSVTGHRTDPGIDRTTATGSGMMMSQPGGTNQKMYKTHTTACINMDVSAQQQRLRRTLLRCQRMSARDDELHQKQQEQQQQQQKQRIVPDKTSISQVSSLQRATTPTSSPSPATEPLLPLCPPSPPPNTRIVTAALSANDDFLPPPSSIATSRLMSKHSAAYVNRSPFIGQRNNMMTCSTLASMDGTHECSNMDFSSPRAPGSSEAEGTESTTTWSIDSGQPSIVPGAVDAKLSHLLTPDRPSLDHVTEPNTIYLTYPPTSSNESTQLLDTENQLDPVTNDVMIGQLGLNRRHSSVKPTPKITSHAIGSHSHEQTTSVGRNSNRVYKASRGLSDTYQVSTSSSTNSQSNRSTNSHTPASLSSTKVPRLTSKKSILASSVHVTNVVRQLGSQQQEQQSQQQQQQQYTSIEQRKQELVKKFAASREPKHGKTSKWQVCPQTGAYKKELMMDVATFKDKKQM